MLDMKIIGVVNHRVSSVILSSLKANMPYVDCSSTSYSLFLKPLLQVNMLYRNIAVEEYLGTFLEPLWILCCHEPDCPML